jgi:oxygen-independent coproporphyrinogen-3 oxidase
MQKKPLHIYIHIPYCKTRCRFCNFYVVAGRTPHLPLYFKALEKEFERYTNLEKYDLKTIYFGGGTPSLVDAKNIKEIIHILYSKFHIQRDIDISVEMNPENITEEKLESYYKSGVRRISIGLQAWQNHLLKYMGRLYTIEGFLEYFQVVQKSKINNFNIDLIFGIPGQTLKDWEETLNNVIKLNPNHISCYSLEVDERSIYGVMETKGLFKRADEQIDREMYAYAKKILKEYGYKHYEISNWAKPGYESKHNLGIWSGEGYIGLGASAHSYFNNLRYHNPLNIDKYVLKTLKNEDVKEEIQEINKDQQMLEYIILQLRLITGLDLNRFEEKFGISFEKKYENQIQTLMNDQLVEIIDNKLILTPLGLDLESRVATEFIP